MGTSSTSTRTTYGLQSAARATQTCWTPTRQDAASAYRRRDSSQPMQETATTMPGWPTRASAHGSQTPAKARDPRAPTRPSSSSGATIVATSGSRTRPAEVDRSANALSRHQSATDKRPFGEGSPDAKWTHGQRWSNLDAPTNLDSRRATYGTSRSTCGSTNACSPWTTSSHTAHGPRTSRVGSTSSMRCTSPRERPHPWAHTSSRTEQAL